MDVVVLRLNAESKKPPQLLRYLLFLGEFIVQFGRDDIPKLWVRCILLSGITSVRIQSTPESFLVHHITCMVGKICFMCSCFY